MKNVFIKDFIRLGNGKLLCGNENLEIHNLSKDTRTIKENDIYLGIKGENFDGNLFYSDALDKGAIACILDRETDVDIDKYKGKTIVLVDDVIKTLQKVATYKRSLYDIPVIAITGSVGKTTTKEMINSVLSKKYKVLKTEGNFNNHIGLPLMILKLKDEEVLVLEMGMNALGEISTLTNIAKPTIGIITNVGTAHIGLLRGRENILKAKLEILEGISAGHLIINNDNDLLHGKEKELRKKTNLVTIGIDNESNYKATNILYKENGASFKIQDTAFKINNPGKAFIYNSLIAYALGKLLDIDDDLIVEALSEYKLIGNRLEKKIAKTGLEIIDDSYNASYESMALGLETLARSSKRKVAILGDMFELGSYSEEIHRLVGKEVHKNQIDVLIAIGKDAKYIYDECSCEKYYFENIEEAFENIETIINTNDIVLIKASHGMHFSKIVDYLVQI